MNQGRYGRREFLQLMSRSAAGAAGVSVLPLSIQRALALTPISRTGSLQDVEHIVILMQENRSFDHYYGTMRGVRGFGDRMTIPLAGGRSVWEQRSAQGGEVVRPFHLDTAKTRAQCVKSLDHGWKSGHEAWNHGRYDGWVDHKTPLTMGHYTKADIPFQFALAEAFTICDQYFCSLMGPTDPNRVYHWTGSVNPPGNPVEALIDNDVTEKCIASWTTCPERLEKAGISWRVYQKGIENDDKRPYEGNYGDNPLLYFRQYIESAAGSRLREEAMTPHPLEELARDVKEGKLPQVSWIVAPEAMSEHPAWPPSYGAQYTAEVLDALTGNPEVWGKTALLINYDENDGFFDHVAPPVPPATAAHGRSTVAAEDEIHQDPELGPMPYGLGARVPMVIVSPWTRGGWVCSEVFDHTSVLRFIEARFGEKMRETNISAWRRAVCGDLTSAFDFSRRDDMRVKLPDTKRYKEETDAACRSLPDPVVPTKGVQSLQERGTRLARAIPYRLSVDAAVKDGALRLDFVNKGKAGAVFQVYCLRSAGGPWVYTVEKGKRLSDVWQVRAVSEERGIADAEGRYGLSVHGPNGFLRVFEGGSGGAGLSARVRYEAGWDRLQVVVKNEGAGELTVSVVDNAYGGEGREYRVSGGSEWMTVWDVARSDGWYDLSVKCGGDAVLNGDLRVMWKTAGRAEAIRRMGEGLHLRDGPRVRWGLRGWD